MSFVAELSWRGMLHDIMPGTEDQLNKEMTAAYVGFDPTADSLHIGNLVSIMLLKHLQVAGHKPFALVGGATGMIGDPSGKSKERNLLDETSLKHNQDAIKKQLSKFLDFDSDAENVAVMVNNYDWMKNFSFLEFIRDVGKHLTVNYMMAKDSVKKRLSSESKDGMSFTEFTYQLVQGYDFLHLYQNHNCMLQMGGSDQWGNITTGTELIRRIGGGSAYAITSPLITKADGSKFGKSEGGNIWLSAEKTSPYKFYQFWLNTRDEDAARYIKIFTLLDEKSINDIIKEHEQAPHQRIIQKKLADEVTKMVHNEDDLQSAIEATDILFGKGTADALKNMDENTLLDVFNGVPTFEISRADFDNGIDLISFLAESTNIYDSKGEARRALKGNAISINKEKVQQQDLVLNQSHLLSNKYLIVQKGKKNFNLVIIS